MEQAATAGVDLDSLADSLVRIANSVEAQAFVQQAQYERYQGDPVGFVHEELGHNLTDDAQRMLRSVLESPVTIAVSANAVGKTFASAAAAVWWWRCFPHSQVILAAAPPSERNLNDKLWARVIENTLRRPDLFTDATRAGLRIVCAQDPGWFIKGVTIPLSGTPDEREAKFSGDHAPHILFILDEGDAIPDEIYKGIDGCMSGGMARLLVMYNPKRRAGAVYRKVRDQQANVVHMKAFDHPNVLTGDDVIPGAVTRQITVKRINEWTQPLQPGERPDASCFKVPEFLVGTTAIDDAGRQFPQLKAGYRRVAVGQFWYAVLGKYPVHGSNILIAQEWIDAARTRYDLYTAQYGQTPPVGTHLVMGLDVADMGEDSNSLCRRSGGFVAPLEMWGGVDPDVTARRAAERAHREKAEHVAVDSTGVGAAVAPAIGRTARLECPQCKEYLGPMPVDDAYVIMDGGSEDRWCQKCKAEREMEFVEAVRVMVGSAPTRRSSFGEFGNLRDQLGWSVREWLRLDKGSMLPPDERLLEEMQIQTYDDSNIKGLIKLVAKVDMRSALGRSPDKWDSLCLTFAVPEGAARVRMIEHGGYEEGEEG